MKIFDHSSQADNQQVYQVPHELVPQQNYNPYRDPSQYSYNEATPLLASPVASAKGSNNQGTHKDFEINVNTIPDPEDINWPRIKSKAEDTGTKKVFLVVISILVLTFLTTPTVDMTLT